MYDPLEKTLLHPPHAFFDLFEIFCNLVFQIACMEKFHKVGFWTGGKLQYCLSLVLQWKHVYSLVNLYLNNLSTVF